MPGNILEPEFGCTHLAEADGDARQDALENIKKLRCWSKALTSSPVRQYHCLQCPHTGSFPSLNTHAKKSNHTFSFEPRSWSLYCGRCRDLVYDNVFELSRYNTNAEKPGRKRSYADVNSEDAFMITNSSDNTCGIEGMRGLINLGETCYMNAIIQMMIHNQVLSSYFLGSGHPLHTCEARAEQMSNGIKEEPGSDSDCENGTSSSPENKFSPRVCIACTLSEVFAESRLVEKSEPMHAVNLLFASWKSFPVRLIIQQR